MRGNFSRDGFDPLKGITRVLDQQGRVTLDSDANERQAIQLHLLRTLAADLIGPHGVIGDGFKIAKVEGLHWDVEITPGHYYVDGWLCENHEAVTWRGEDDHKRQPWLDEQPQPRAGISYLAYLELWERYVCAAEQDGLLAPDAPGRLREVALGGPDTVGKAQLIWQIRLREAPPGAGEGTPEVNRANAEQLLRQWNSASRGRLAARGRAPPGGDSDPCVVPPHASYRGIENQLYRIEIYRGGSAKPAAGQTQATFIWSRDNGSVVLPVESVSGERVQLAAGWRDARSDSAVGDHVEISDEAIRMNPGAGPIRRVTAYDPDSDTVMLDASPGPEVERTERGLALRRWDHRKGDPKSGYPALADHALQLVEDEWLTIEDGISICFAPGTPTHTYRSGDYWLIPARVDLGDIIWPRDADQGRTPRAVPPHGVDRHFAPLAMVTFAANGEASPSDLRRILRPLDED